MAATEQPDAILLDVMIPDFDGIATLEQLKANSVTQLIPVIFLTAKVQSGDRDRFAQLDIVRSHHQTLQNHASSPASRNNSRLGKLVKLVVSS